jgi:hypothetical protein
VGWQVVVAEIDRIGLENKKQQEEAEGFELKPKLPFTSS